MVLRKVMPVLGVILVLLLATLTAGGCPRREVERTELILATTTSTADSGLLDVLNRAFEERHPFTLKTIAVGTGEALRLGEQREADVLLVHARRLEDQFMAAGHGARRLDVMYNDFVIVGPPGDPAGIRGMTLPGPALARVAERQALFASRGDNSGTHVRENSLWQAAGITPAGEWYLSTGQGMGDTLRIASEKQAYTLTDRGTYLAQKDRLELEIMVEGDPGLLNPYGVIEVQGAKNAEGAKAFADFITSAEGQQIIAEFGKDRFGQPLFFPLVHK